MAKNVLNEIKQKAKAKLDAYKAQKDEEKAIQFNVIVKILDVKDAFSKIDAELMINILTDIYDDRQTAINVYKKVLDETIKN